MINVYDRSLRKTAVLQNAYDVVETKELNAVGSLVFSLPDEDDKNAYCQPFHYVRYGDDGDLYRIISPGGTRADTGASTYTCEHVVATLVDDVLWGAHVIGNIGVYTSECINYVLDHQTTRHWVLDTCEFSRQFEYSWECENLLAALFSIPNRFVENYMWEYDTNNYPWRISLKFIDESQKPQFYIRAGKNLLRSTTGGKAQDVCTRLYGLGYGEGVNQLTIKEVNNGLPYIDAPQEYIDRYGLISRIFVDRRFESAQSLKERMESLLNELKEPKYSRTISIADLYELTGYEYDKADIGRITMLSDDNTKTYITKTIKRWDQPGDMTITLSTKADDIVSSIADLADRQRIEQVYAQGATQIYAQSIQANATPDIGAELSFYVPDEMRIVNAVKAKITLSAFRSYSRSTRGGGASTQTSSSGGESRQTSSSGGESTQTSSSGGSSTQTSRSGGGGSTSSEAGGGTETTSGPSSRNSADVSNFNNDYTGYTSVPEDPLQTGSASGTGSHSHSYWSLPRHRHEYGSVLEKHVHRIDHTHRVTVAPHTHTVRMNSHTHAIDIPGHTHSVSVPGHTHSVSIPGHSHTVRIPEHTHTIEQGIFTFGSASGANIYVNGKLKGSMGTDHEVEITPYLLNDSNQIPRGQWMRVEIRPNDLAYVTIDMFIQGFIQSRGGSSY